MIVELTLKDETQRNKVAKFLQGHLPWGSFVLKSKKKMLFALGEKTALERETLLVALRMLSLQQGSCRKDYRDLVEYQHLDVKAFPNRKVPNLVIDGVVCLVLPQKEWQNAVDAHPELRECVVTSQGLQSSATWFTLDVVEKLQDEYLKTFGNLYV